MVHRPGSDQHGGMTETPPPDGGPGAGSGSPQPGPRVSTEQIKDLDRLRRSTTDRKVAGVAGGLGRHLDIDPVLLRVAFVVLCFFGGAGFLLYGAAWLLVPEDGRTEATVATSASTRNTMLVVAAVLAAFLLMGDAWGGFGFPWPLAVLAVVAFVVLMNREGTDQPAAPAAPPAPTGPPNDATGSAPEAPWTAAPSWMPPTRPAYQQPAPPAARRGPLLFWPTVALVALGLGVLGFVEGGGADVPTAAYPALALTIIGAMLLLGAWFGRAGGLTFLGILAAIALAVTSVVDTTWGSERSIDAAPATAAQVRDDYSVPAGAIRLDLSDVDDLHELDGRTIDVRADVGEIVVTVPDGVDVDVQADVNGAGEAVVAGRESNGLDVHVVEDIDGGTDVPTMALDISLFIGSIEVRQS